MADKSHRDHANRLTHTAVRDLVQHMLGEDGFEERPWLSTSSITSQFPTPEAALAAAVLLRDEAASQVPLQVRACRGRGASWEHVAGLLGITGDNDGYTPAQRAFHVVAPEEPYSFRPSRTWWDCSTCGKYVTDHGPFDNDPDDTETGHAPDCARHQAANDAWRQLVGDE